MEHLVRAGVRHVALTPSSLDEALLQAAAMARHPDWIRAAARPLIPVLRSTLPGSVGTSRLGGEPDLPPDLPWPTHEAGPYRFLAQLALRELPPNPLIPRTGLLSLFVADDEDQSVFWQDEHYVVAHLFADPTALVRRPCPPDLEQPGITGRFGTVELDLPRAPEQRTDWPEGLADPLTDWWHQQRPQHPAYLLGYPAVSTLAYDPTPGPGWTSLLTLRSDRELDWSWHDGAYLHLFIERSRLAAGDFSRIVADAG